MTEPIAIVGMACRFPGAATPAAYWQLLVDGTEVVREPPAARAELEPPPWLVAEAPSCRRGGFLADLDRFEPSFFRISPREAARMDPQQRLLLEVAWEALEDAGQPVARLAGTATGVFVGVMNADFARRHARDLTQIDAQLGPGSSLGIAPNRVSFVLDLRGPSMAIDTLCSSSLVAIHLACQSLLADESFPVAIAGGVNVILDRTMDVFYARAGLLAKDGRCRAFDAGASGIVRGEGIGLVVLKRLSRAVADGDRIHAVIRGSAVNQDGRSNGLTSPSRWSQEHVLRTAYRRAGVTPGSVAYVEAHGTGTLIGDPIETAALGAVMNEGRAPGTTCAIGSVKTNLGHLESAAGVASLIKTVLSLEHRTLVPSLHFERPNPYARFEERGLEVPTRVRPWPAGEPVAGVSSFGMGGTNAHVVLGASEATDIARPPARRASLIPISARSITALNALEARVLERLATGVEARDIAHSMGVRRDHHDHRRALVVGPRAVPASAGSVVPGRTHRLVFVLPDDVACDRACAEELAADERVCRATLDRDLAEGASVLGAYQAALVAWWRSIGFEPDEIVRVPRGGAAALSASLGEDSTVFVELSPRPILVDELRGMLAGAGAAGAAVSSVVPELGAGASLLHAIGALYCLGFAVDWQRLDAPEARFVRLGTYPWDAERCALEAPPSLVALPELVVPSWVRKSPPHAMRSEPGEWLVLGDGTIARALVAGLESAGHRARVGDARGAETARGVVQICGADLAPTVRLVQALARRGDAAPRLWLVTRGACVVDDGASLASLASSTVWGFGRVVMNEHPGLRCTLVDLPASEVDIEMLIRELAAGDDEREVAIRGTARYVARLGRQTLAAPATRLQLRGDAGYLVTGGLGGLGIAAARRLVERGARTLVLVSRRGVASEQARLAIAELEAGGATVIVERADVADREAMAGVLRRHRVCGVIHAAGVMSPAMIAAIDADELGATLAAKVDGARHLHDLTASQPLDFFVLYSSVATLLGMPGQAAYAAANAYLDALAAHRRALGLPATSIAWTVIEGTGMAASAGAKAIGQLADRGVATLAIDRATDLLERLLESDAPAHVGAVSFDLGRWTAYYPHARSIARLMPLAPSTLAPAREAAARPARTLASELRARPDRMAAVEVYLCEALAAVLHDSELDPLRPLSDLGMDSLTAIELQSLVKADLDVEVPSERLLGGVSIRELAVDIAAQLGGNAPPTAAKVPIRWHGEAQLDPSIAFARRDATAPRSILLTGATGFLGAFVLAELLEHSKAQIHCLVRARSERDGIRRLEDTLGRYDLPALDLAERVTCLPGDLAQPRLGLAGDQLDRLASSLDTIVHSGASVNFVFPYEALKPANVAGTHEILRLAAASRARLHHVSTVGVFPGGPQRRDTVLETARPTEPERLALGYMRAKWVAEELVVQARDRGLDVSIYRPGTIAGHSRSGAYNPDDFVCALIKGCVQLGLAPRVDAPIHLVPVDYVSRALVRIALGPAAGTYHLVGPRPVAWAEVVEWIRRLGYRIAELPYREWRAAVIERAVATGNALAPLLPLFVEHDSTGWLHLPTYDDAETKAALAGTDIACAAVDAALMRRYVERFVISGYLPRPR
ncbi:MAG TPA: thioester reductase domain-containing protein [Kofleriaceae bacterium]|nr:thioester reductase domain-containing protein [Kofleriaceae bacterium]